MSSFTYKGERMYQCNSCWKNIKKHMGIKELKQHLLLVHDHNPVHCLICGKLYKNHFSLSKHQSKYHNALSCVKQF